MIKKNPGRCFVIDGSAVMLGGHNVHAVLSFCKEMERCFVGSVPIVSKTLHPSFSSIQKSSQLLTDPFRLRDVEENLSVSASSVAPKNKPLRLSFLCYLLVLIRVAIYQLAIKTYLYFAKIMSSLRLIFQKCFAKFGISTRGIFYIVSFFRKCASILNDALVITCKFFWYKTVKVKLKKEYSAFFKTWNVSQDDYLFFPSASYFDIVSVIKKCSLLPADKIPRLHFRFINVYEYSPWAPSGRGLGYFSAITRSPKFKDKLTLTAETSIYAEYCSVILGRKVTVLPLPPTLINIKSSSGSEDNHFTVLFPGSPRENKGFYRIYDIITLFRKRYPSCKVRFVLQDMKPVHRRNNQYSDYIRSMNALYDVDILHFSITSEEYDIVYASADLIVLPYQTSIFTGSGVLSEAVFYKKSVLFCDDAGFSEFAQILGVGFKCHSITDYVNGIFHSMNMKNSLKDKNSEKAEQKYLDIFYKSLSEVI